MEVIDADENQNKSIKLIYKNGELFTLGIQDGIFGIETILSSIYVYKYNLLFRGEWNKSKNKHISILSKSLWDGDSYGNQ